MFAPFPQLPASSRRKLTCLGNASHCTPNKAHFLGVRKKTLDLAGGDLMDNGPAK